MGYANLNYGLYWVRELEYVRRRYNLNHKKLMRSVSGSPNCKQYAKEEKLLTKQERIIIRKGRIRMQKDPCPLRSRGHAFCEQCTGYFKDQVKVGTRGKPVILKKMCPPEEGKLCDQKQYSIEDQGGDEVG